MFPINWNDAFRKKDGTLGTMEDAGGGGGGSALPEYSSSDAGKVLGVDSEGALEWMASGVHLYRTTSVVGNWHGLIYDGQYFILTPAELGSTIATASDLLQILKNGAIIMFYAGGIGSSTSDGGRPFYLFENNNRFNLVILEKAVNYKTVAFDPGSDTLNQSITKLF